MAPQFQVDPTTRNRRAMAFVDAFNAVEAVWWAAMAFVSWRQGRNQWKPVGRTAAASLAVFAVTDVIEIQTGAWWNPWWLGVAKGICVISLIGCGTWVWRIKRK